MDMKMRERKFKMLELRYNPYHDPSNGRFTSGGGSGGGGILVVPRGQKGKGYYASLNKGYSDEEIDDMYEEFAKNSPKKLDSKMIARVNAQGSNFYDSGSAVERQYNREFKEIDTLNISDSEKSEAKDKIYDYANRELQARTRYFDLYAAGPARKVGGSDKAFDKITVIRNAHENYMDDLRSKSDRNTLTQKKNAEADAFKSTAAEANKTGAREMTVNGQNWFRTTKTSRTWQEGTLRDYNAKKAFDKSQKDVWMGARKSWSSLTEEEKRPYYK